MNFNTSQLTRFISEEKENLHEKLEVLLKDCQELYKGCLEAAYGTEVGNHWSKCLIFLC